MADPTFDGDKWIVPKDPDNKRYFKFGFAKALTDAGTTPHASRPPIIVTSGATVGSGTANGAPDGSGICLAIHPDAQPNVQVVGTDVIVFLGGLDVRVTVPPVSNFCTVRLNCANGEDIDSTMWFVRKDG